MSPQAKVKKVMERLEAMGSPDVQDYGKRFGIVAAKAYGIKTPELRALAKELGRDHALALALWNEPVHEAKKLAGMLADPKQVTGEMMERWAADFASWDICDQCCYDLFDRTPFAYAKAAEWAHRPEEYVKRGGFALMAGLAVHDKKAPDEKFLAFLPHIEREAGDARNFVKKAVNWALRSIGKRNRTLNAAAIESAERILKQDSPAARWVASDTLRELRSENVRRRLDA
ncbi:MAG: DNA alkylation repair protein [SAR202 cluster bacterium]|nr:DNA alkylation repair protein [SAR202 cluster bacterium]